MEMHQAIHMANFEKKNILIIRHTHADVAKKFNKSPDDIRQILTMGRARLWEVRSERPRPHLDDKTLTSWNGLMISAFARGYQVFGHQSYLDSALNATAFIEKHLYDETTGKLYRRHREGEVAIEGFVDDYAYMIQGLLDLYEASFDVRYLGGAIELQKKQNELFWDYNGGGYFNTAGVDPNIILRLKDDYDGAEPSANSIAALNLLRLSQMTDNKDYRERAEKMFSVFSSRLQRSSSALPQMLAAFDFYIAKPKQIIIAGNRDAPDTLAMLREVQSHFIPNKIILLADGESGQEILAQHLEFIKDVRMINGKATAYICEDYVCQLPTNQLETMRKLLLGNEKPKPGS